MNKPPLALLIDGENVSASHMPAIMDHAKRLGEPLARCVVGDFCANRLSDWADIAPGYALETYFQRSGGKNKNSADIALTIRAMDLLAEGRFGSFLVVSSDRDFAPLALRLRRSGFPVYGMGAPTAGSGWRSACTEFYEFESKPPAEPNGSTEPKSAAAKQIPTSARPVLSKKDREDVHRILQDAAPAGSAGIAGPQLGILIRSKSPELADRFCKGRLTDNLRADPLVEVREEVGKSTKFVFKGPEQPKRAAALPTPPRPSPSEARPRA